MAITHKLLTSLCWSAAPLALMASPTPVLAQDAPVAESTGGGLEEIIVTARRIDERAQQVPIAITAFSQDNLREKGVNNGTDLQNYTPSLSVVGDVARNQETYSI